MGSTRLPGKVLKRLNGLSIIEILFSRLSKAKLIDEIILATSNEPQDKALIEHIENLGYKTFAGSQSNVLSRYYNIAKQYRADSIVRITGDCPLIDPFLVDKVIAHFFETKV